MNIKPLKIDGLYQIVPRVFEDNRGAFVKQFQSNIFKESGINFQLKEQYFSVSHRGVVRGMHFQIPPHDHDKLVYCITGSVFDVAVDLRTNSPSYGKHVSIILESNKYNALFIPKGFAHGFCSLENNSCMVYNVSTEYEPESDRGIRFDSCGVNWPLDDVISNKRDLNFPVLVDFKSPF